jgi:hypothetical protein
MNLATHLIRRGASRILAAREVNRIRAEHDAWARTATIDTTYYTGYPHCQYDEQPGRPVHIPYRFTGKGHGHRASQLITDTGAGSWDLWYQHGPLTTQRMPTSADYRKDDNRAFTAFAAQMNEINARVDAEMRRLYPASLELVAA